MAIKGVFAHGAHLLVQAVFLSGAHAAQSQRDPTAVLDALADRLYVIGETSGSAAQMIAAEAAAADEIRRYIVDGSTAGLLVGPTGKQTPLAAAAAMGYPNVLAALLTSEAVRAHVDDADEMGITPWIAANFSIRQSLWTCNPAVFDDPFKFVPLVVTLPFYLANPEPPYKKTRELLEKAGAPAIVAKARDAWITRCKNESDAAKLAVQASGDMQKTVQALAEADLRGQLIKLRQRAVQRQREN